jgi:hypothetical protein
MLMIEGNIIYNGNSLDSLRYFKDIGFPVPLQQNSMDYFLKIMNK